MKNSRPSFSVRQAARELLRRQSESQKQVLLALLRDARGGAFVERVCRYADAHPGAAR